MKDVVSPIEVECSGDHLETGTGNVIAVLEVESTSFDTRTEKEIQAVYQAFRKVLDSVNYRFYLHSRQEQTGLNHHVSQLNGRDLGEIRDEYVDYCRSLSEQGIVETRHYVVLGVEAAESSVKTLSNRVKQLIRLLRPLNLGVERLVDEQLQRFVEAVQNPDPEPSRNCIAVPNEGFDEYRRLVYVTEYPKKVRFGWPIDLLRVNGLTDITQVLQPVNTKTAKKRFNFHAERLEAEINALLAGDSRSVHKLDRLLDDVNYLLDLLANGESHPYKYGVYITAHGSDRATVDQTLENVTTCLDAKSISHEEPFYRNDYGYCSDSPLHGDLLDEKLWVPSDSGASGFPFGTQPFKQNGMIYGTDTKDRTPVILERFSWDSHSLAIMGASGSGKSYLSKLCLLRLSLTVPDLRVIVIDPKKEYGRVIRELGGEHRIAVRDKEHQFDQQVLGYEVLKRGDEVSVEALITVLQQAYAAVSQDQKKTVVLIDEASTVLDDPQGRKVLRKLVLQARASNTSTQIVTQSASHFTDYEKGKDILNNIPAKLLFKHEVISDSMQDYFKFSLEKQNDLRYLPTGDNGFSEAFIQVSNWLDTCIEVEATPAEHPLVRSSQAEKALGKKTL